MYPGPGKILLQQGLHLENLEATFVLRLLCFSFCPGHTAFHPVIQESKTFTVQMGLWVEVFCPGHVCPVKFQASQFALLSLPQLVSSGLFLKDPAWQNRSAAKQLAECLVDRDFL